MYCLECQREVRPEHFTVSGYSTHNTPIISEVNGEKVYTLTNTDELTTLLDELSKHASNNYIKVELQVYSLDAHKWYSVYSNPKHRGIGLLGLVQKLAEIGNIETVLQDQFKSTGKRLGTIGACKMIVVKR